MKKFINFLIAFCCLLSAVIAQQKKSTYPLQFNFKHQQGNWYCTSFSENILKITFQPKQYATNENISDAVIMKPLLGKHFNHSVISANQGILIDNNCYISYYETDNGYKGFSIKLHQNEKIFGGGERALPFNRRGYQFNLYNNPWYAYGVGADNLNYSVPFFTSSNGYGLFFDNPSKGIADIGKTNANAFNVSFCSGELTMYLIIAKKYDAILQTYHQLTGTQPMPPLWAFGNIMSRFGYTSQQQAQDIATKMQQDTIAVDAIIFDLFWFGDSIKGTLGNLDWVNKKAWPQPKKMITDFKQQGIHTILITEPYLVKNTKYYKEALPYFSVDKNNKPYLLTDFYFGNGGLLDMFRNDVQQWFWKKHLPQMTNGVEGWWGDLGEPERHPTNLYHNLKDKGFKRLFAADEVHNIYGHTWTKMLYQNFATQFPNKRLFSLNRSGFAGTQRYSIFPWTGDVGRTWSGLQAQLPVLLGMSMSGIPYVHSDAGGFALGEHDSELYVRWLQMAAFTPIFKPHGTALYDVDTSAISFPSEAALLENPYKQYAKKVIDLRYHLLPYNYSLAYQQTNAGKPLMRPMYYNNETDTNTYHLQEQYCWGEKIIVAPIVEKNSTTKKIWLPQNGAYKFETNVYLTEGLHQDSASLATQLLYVPQGSIIPTLQTQAGANTKAYHQPVIQWQYYASKNVNATDSFTLYEDDGANKFSIAQKKYELITVYATTFANGYTFKIISNGGTYSTKQTKRKMQIQLYGNNLPVSTYYINSNTKANTIQPNNANQPITIEFEFAQQPIEIKLQ